MILFKHKKDAVLFPALHPILIMIVSDLWWYTYEKHGVELVITQTITTMEEDLKLNRVSSSHRESRAIDISVRDQNFNIIDDFIIDDITHYINTREDYSEYKYLSNSGKKRLAYYHDNSNGAHIHLAIHSKFNIYSA